MKNFEEVLLSEIHKGKCIIFNSVSSGIKGVVYDSGESLLTFELNSQTNTPLPSVLLQTHSISLSCAWVRVVTYYSEVFSGNMAKASVFHTMGWCLYPSREGPQSTSALALGTAPLCCPLFCFPLSKCCKCKLHRRNFQTVVFSIFLYSEQDQFDCTTAVISNAHKWCLMQPWKTRRRCWNVFKLCVPHRKYVGQYSKHNWCVK